MEREDYYYTIKKKAQGVFKDRGSKFIALAIPVATEAEAQKQLKEVKKQYYDARHHCYAYRIDPEQNLFKSSDDGEPSGTAGKPILNQLLSKELFQVMVVVVRYFGGIKLGTGGLINAYKTATREALSNAGISKVMIYRKITLEFDYPLMNKVMRVVKEENVKIAEQKFELSCLLTLDVEKSRESILRKKFESIFGITVK